MQLSLRWDVADRIETRVSTTCVAAPYLVILAHTTQAQVAERQHLRSASRNLLVAPRFQLNTYGRRTVAVAAPATWNSLSDELRNPDLHSTTFLRNLKDVSVATIIPGASSALEALCDYALYKSTFTLHYVYIS